jgi:acetyltransferase-like isoleucine patch superfamily enzyme
VHYYIYTPLINGHLGPVWRLVADSLQAVGADVTFISCRELEVQSRQMTLTIESGKAANKHLKSYVENDQIIFLGEDSDNSCDAIVEKIVSNIDYRILIWNGEFPYQDEFLSCCKNKEVEEKIIFLEMGWFPQGESLYASTGGVNFKSTIKDCQLDTIRDEQRTILTEWLSRQYPHYNKCSVVAKTIFVPLQVDTDTTIRLYSPFKSMKAFVEFLDDWIPADYQIVVKLHPKAEYSYLFPAGRGRMRFVDSGDVADHLASAEYVVGINSTVLLEGLVAKKKVIAFGRGIYSSQGVLLEPEVSEKFPEQYAIQEKVVEDFLYYLIFRRQIPLESLRAGDGRYLFNREPFSSLHEVDTLDIDIREGKKMIKVGNSKIAKSAFLDCEKEGLIEIGDDCEIRHNAVLEVSGRYNGSIKIGKHSVVGVNNWLQGSGQITIGDDVIMGPNVSLVSTNHMYEDVETPIAQQPLVTGYVTIEDDVWIGANVTVAYNVTVGAHSIIGANSFVNQDIPPYSIVAGSPAKVIKSRV